MKVPMVKLPKVKLKDMDWKWFILLLVLMFVTVADDPTVVGELMDPIELPIDAIVAWILGRKMSQNAAAREGVIVEGRVIKPGDSPTQSTSDATELDQTLKGRKSG